MLRATTIPAAAVGAVATASAPVRLKCFTPSAHCSSATVVLDVRSPRPACIAGSSISFGRRLRGCAPAAPVAPFASPPLNERKLFETVLCATIARSLAASQRKGKPRLARRPVWWKAKQSVCVCVCLRAEDLCKIYCHSRFKRN